MNHLDICCDTCYRKFSQTNIVREHFITVLTYESCVFVLRAAVLPVTASVQLNGFRRRLECNRTHMFVMYIMDVNVKASNLGTKRIALTPIK